MIELLLASSAGILIGILAGLIPGIGVSVSLILLYPLLMMGNPAQLIAFYIAVISATQYAGSVISTFMGIPGEASSLPAVREGHNMFLRGRGSYAISGAAMGSLVGSMIALLLTLSVFPMLTFTVWLYNTKVQLMILLVAATFLCINANNKWWQSFILFAFGYLLGMVGYDDHTEVDFTFGIPELYGGIPIFPVLISLYAVPEILKIQTSTVIDIKQTSVRLITHWLEIIQHKWSVIRWAIVGYFCGFVPGLTVVLASNASYALEKKLKGGLDGKGDYGGLVTAETANNAAAFTSLIPLLGFGIPILASEAIIYHLMLARGFSFTMESLVETGLFAKLAICLVLVNFICLIICWPLAKYLPRLLQMHRGVLMGVGFSIVAIALCYLGLKSNQLWLYWMMTIGLGIVGVLLRRFDTMPIIFAYVLQSNIEDGLYRLSQLL